IDKRWQQCHKKGFTQTGTTMPLAPRTLLLQKRLHSTHRRNTSQKHIAETHRRSTSQEHVAGAHRRSTSQEHVAGAHRSST
ncbi:hypothetical protein LSAT2_002702, partial [Lamellibrachia satsuma]